MAQQTINLGTPPAGLDGDDARTAFTKANENFTELYGVTNNPKISAIAASVWAANQLMYTTGTSTVAMTSLTAGARALLGTAGVTNGVPYYTSASAASTAASTAYGRGLWNLADAAAGRTALALGTAATATMTTSSSDTGPNRVTKVGDFGLGSSASTDNGAMSGLVASSLFQFSEAAPTEWPGSGQGLYPMGLNFHRSVAVRSQLAVSYGDAGSGAGVYYRQSGRGALTSLAWVKLLERDDIVGTVNQSGGVPTGAIIERGVNSNGEYTRFADGTQICMISMANTAIAVNTTSGSLFQSGNVSVTWPMPFSATPTVSSFVGRVSTDTICLGIVLRSVSSADCYFKWWSSFSSGSLGVFGSILAIGRWF